VKERIRIKIDGQLHYIGIKELYSTTSTIEISSDPQQVVFNIGDENKFDVTDNGFYDLSVILNSIESNKANITIKSVSDENIEVLEEDEGDILDNLGEAIGKSKLKFWIIIGVIVLVVAIVVGIIIKKREDKSIN
jgi:hypothetical protein